MYTKEEIIQGIHPMLELLEHGNISLEHCADQLAQHIEALFQYQLTSKKQIPDVNS